MAAITNVQMQMPLILRKICAYKLVDGICCSCHSRNIAMSVRSGQRRNEKSNIQQDSGEFRAYEIPGLKVEERKRFIRRWKKEVPPPRFRRMLPDQDWTNVWPAAATFKWSVVPLPVRQGVAERVTENDGVVPDKYANAELMKPPNFLHLTPNHIKKQCQAIKKFCTKWPKELGHKSIEWNFPVTVTTADYCFASPSIRDDRARTVTIQLKLSHLKLDYHARDKLYRLVGRRYDPTTDTLTITTNRCPARHQNYDYAMYLLTAIYYESWKTEAWESDKAEADMERYHWDNSRSSEAILGLLQRCKEIDQNADADKSDKKLPYLPSEVSETTLLDLEPVKAYKEAMLELNNEGENFESLTRYKNSVKKILGLQTS